MKVFLAGPVDTQDLDFIHSYRTRYGRLLAEVGFEVVDPYAQTIEKIVGLELRSPRDLFLKVKDLAEEIKRLDDPYLNAVVRFLLNTKNPDLSVFPDEVNEADLTSIVERDLNLMSTADMVVAYLPKPSFGTAVEVIKARELGKKVFIFNEGEMPIPIFARYYATSVFKNSVDMLKSLKLIVE